MVTILPPILTDKIVKVKVVVYMNLFYFIGYLIYVVIQLPKARCPLLTSVAVLAHSISVHP
jgi:hypothetical protein